MIGPPRSTFAIGLVLAAQTACAQTRAFPGAEGFGAYAKGGRGGHVVYVTSLEDYPAGQRPIPGTLRWAVEELSGPRTILFKVGGTIALTRRLVLEGPAGSFVTIAGQSAPGDGIQITCYGLGIFGAHDVVVRYVRFRVGYCGPGEGHLKDALTIGGQRRAPARNIIIDHCSLEWAIDENGDVAGAAENVTFQWCIFAEGAMFGHPEGGPASAGFLAAGADGVPSDTYLTIHHSLFMSNLVRNPRLGQNGGLAELVNNYICNWGDLATDFIPAHDHSPRANIIGNVYARGSAFRKGLNMRPILVWTHKGREVSEGAIHVRDNLSDVRPDSGADDWENVGLADEQFKLTRLDERKHRRDAWPVERQYRVTTDPAERVVDHILAGVGANHLRRDTVDARLIEQGRARQGRLGFGPSVQDHERWPALRGGTPPADGDLDGMPDDWEGERRLNPNDPKDGPADRNLDGYTNLEEYLNGLIGS